MSKRDGAAIKRRYIKRGLRPGAQLQLIKPLGIHTYLGQPIGVLSKVAKVMRWEEASIIDNGDDRMWVKVCDGYEVGWVDPADLLNCIEMEGRTVDTMDAFAALMEADHG